MLAAFAALSLAVSLILEGTAHPIPGRWFALAGLALLALAVLVPYRPHIPSGRLVVSETPQHPAVTHAVHLRRKLHREGMGPVGRANDWAATHLAVVFGISWTIWVFFIWPLLAQFFDAEVQAKTSYYAQSWVQLFALPLMVYVGNKLQRSSDAQSEVMHTALTHIATVSDQNKALIEQNNELTAQVHALVTAQAESTVAADAKGARQSAEAAFAGVQALAAVAVAKPQDRSGGGGG